ncbi:hypothetical protein C8R42DRAFT_774946 [Lentinula raphanica]|nr:hypothetical protein C8R42DRAFT_774946 [Lentinula raphanica]
MNEDQKLKRRSKPLSLVPASRSSEERSSTAKKPRLSSSINSRAENSISSKAQVDDDMASLIETQVVDLEENIEVSPFALYEARIKSLEAEVAQYQAKLDEHETTIAYISERRNMYHTSSQNSDTRVTELEARITTLEAAAKEREGKAKEDADKIRDYERRDLKLRNQAQATSRLLQRAIATLPPLDV